MGSITSANAVVMISIANVFDAPQRMQGFTADDIFDIEDVAVSENVMGVDGIKSTGYVNAMVSQTIALQADSISNDVIDGWFKANKLAQESYIAQATVILKSLGKKFTCTNGSLARWKPMPSAARVLQPRRAVIIWESVTQAPV